MQKKYQSVCKMSFAIYLDLPISSVMQITGFLSRFRLIVSVHFPDQIAISILKQFCDF